MAGLCNTLCITEFNPSIYMMYNKDEIPSFKNKEECLNIINDFLNNEEKLSITTKKFHQKSILYGDSQYIKNISNFINSIPIKKNKRFITPIWYNLIFLKQSLRLRFKRTIIIGFLKEFLLNFQYYNNYKFITYTIQLFMNMVYFLRFFPLLLLRMIFKTNNEKN